MFRFSSEQKVFDISGVKVGGQPGENPTVMIGSIFYTGDRTVKDEKTGIFDRVAVESSICKLEETSDRTGLPAMLDVVCSTAENARKYLEFAADVTKMPLLIDYVSETAGLSGLETAKDLGILDRTILNSINPETKPSIYDKAKEVGLQNAIALTYSSKAVVSYKERIKLLEPLLLKIQAAGIKKILVDTVVLDIATLGLACKAIFQIKESYGYPTGCGAHNAVASWKSLQDKKDKTLSMVCASIASGLPIAIGADFVLYGPISDAEYIFRSIGIINAAYAQILMEEGKRPPLNHPRFRISRL